MLATIPPANPCQDAARECLTYMQEITPFHVTMYHGAEDEQMITVWDLVRTQRYYDERNVR